jgi:hypothetical protein
MVKKIDSMFICEECDLKFKEEKWAKACEEWCAKHHTCNIEICKHATHD